MTLMEQDSLGCTSCLDRQLPTIRITKDVGTGRDLIAGHEGGSRVYRNTSHETSVTCCSTQGVEGRIASEEVGTVRTSKGISVSRRLASISHLGTLLAAVGPVCAG